MRSSGLNRRRFEAFTPTATTTSSKSVDARTMMSMCPLVTGSNDPGQAARRTMYSFRSRVTWRPWASLAGCATVPKQGLAVLPHPVAHEPVRPLQLRPPARPLHHHQRVPGEPVVVAESTERGDDVADGHGVRRVGEGDVVQLARARCAGPPPRG